VRDKEFCRLCPRECGVDRSEKTGFCRSGNEIRVAKAMLHQWEEPCISGTEGSGAIFFSGCSLRCVFCQNYAISAQNFGQDISANHLARIMLNLQDSGAHNINLVNPTHFVKQIMQALSMVKDRLTIPVVYNCGGYEKIETIKSLDGYVDIYLPDFKYFNNEIAKRYSAAPDYFERASSSIGEMIQQTGPLQFNGNLLTKGVIIRHMVLPMQYRDSIKIVEYIAKTYPRDCFLLSLLSQYTPMHRAAEFPEINRCITSFEYETVCRRAEELHLDGFIQKRQAADKAYTPIFDLSGI